MCMPACAAPLRLCADGGARRALAVGVPLDQPPSVILGDFDSYAVRVPEWSTYERQFVDNETTDFDKCVAWLRRHRRRVDDDGNADDYTVVAGALGGPRVDHILGNLNTALRVPRCILWGPGDSVLLALPAGEHRVVLPSSSAYVGVVPVLARVCVSTTGLRWDMDHDVLEWGGRLSTSNHPVADVVHCDVDQPCWFSIASSDASDVSAPLHAIPST